MVTNTDNPDLPPEFVEELKETMKQDRSLAEPFEFNEYKSVSEINEIAIKNFSDKLEKECPALNLSDKNKIKEIFEDILEEVCDDVLCNYLT